MSLFGWIRRGGDDPDERTSLTDLEDCHASELAVHLIVIHGRTSLVEWYDLPRDPIAVALSVGKVAVERFAAAVGGPYEISKAGA